MSMKKIVAFILLGAALVLCLSACQEPTTPPEVTTVPVKDDPGNSNQNDDTLGITYEPLSDTTCMVVSYVGSNPTPTIPTRDEDDRLVVAIGEGAFAGKEYITSVKLPLSVQTIEAGAFRDCIALISVTWPSHLVTVKAGAFAGCISLTSVKLPAEVATVEQGAFEGCTALTRITVDEGNTAFASDGQLLTSKDGTHLYLAAASGGLTTFESGAELTTVSAYAFAGHKTLTAVTLGDQVTEIGEYAFSDCSALTAITLGKGITYVPDGLCRRSKLLASVVLPDGLTHIGTSAFDGCSALSDLSVPATVSRVGLRALAGTAFLKNATDEFVVVGNGVLLDWNGEGSEVTVPDGITYLSDVFHGDKITAVTLPESLTVIGENAFRSCSLLERVTLPTTLAEIGQAAFYGCTALQEVSGLDQLDGVTVADGNQSLTDLVSAS